MNRKVIAQYGDLVTRVVTGLIFLIAGITKFQNIQGTAGFFESIGVPLAQVMAPVVATIEVVAGALLILGLWTHITASLLAIIIVVAIVVVHVPNGWAAEGGVRYPLLLLAVLIRYIGTSGYLSLPELMGKK